MLKPLFESKKNSSMKDPNANAIGLWKRRGMRTKIIRYKSDLLGETAKTVLKGGKKINLLFKLYK